MLMEQCKRNLHETSPLCFSKIYVFKPLQCTTQFTARQVTSSGFSIKPSADLFINTNHTKNLYMCVGLRFLSLTTYVLNYRMSIKTVVVI